MKKRSQKAGARSRGNRGSSGSRGNRGSRGGRGNRTFPLLRCFVCFLCFLSFLYLLCVICLPAAQAQTPALTTVKDTVYKSDGSIFAGTVTVSWNPFISADGKSVFGGTKSVTVLAPLNPPGVPAVTVVGTPGPLSYYYWVSATNANGETTLSLPGPPATANATLSATNYDTIAWTAVTGATGYKVYRTTTSTAPSGSGSFLVGTTSALTLNDQSNTLGWVTVPAANTTASLAVALVPNAGATPSGTSYVVTYSQAGGVTSRVVICAGSDTIGS